MLIALPHSDMHNYRLALSVLGLESKESLTESIMTTGTSPKAHTSYDVIFRRRDLPVVS